MHKITEPLNLATTCNLQPLKDQRHTEGPKTHRRFTYSLDVQMLNEGPQADLGLWAITTLGIKYLMTTDTTQKITKTS